MDKKELLSKLDACETKESLNKFLKDFGSELTDEELEVVSGGTSIEEIRAKLLSSSKGTILPLDID